MTSIPQRLALAVGETGCYALCIVKIAEEILGEPLDPLATIAWGLDGNGLEYDDPKGLEGIYVRDAGRFLSTLTNATWICVHATPDYATKPGQREVLRFERPVAPPKEPAHFVLGDGNGKIIWDPFGWSETVRLGTLASKRIFTRR